MNEKYKEIEYYYSGIRNYTLNKISENIKKNFFGKYTEKIGEDIFVELRHELYTFDGAVMIEEFFIDNMEGKENRFSLEVSIKFMFEETKRKYFFGVTETDIFSLEDNFDE